MCDIIMQNLKPDKAKDQYFTQVQNQCQALTLLYQNVSEVSRVVCCLFYAPLFCRRIHLHNCEIKCHYQKPMRGQMYLCNYIVKCTNCFITVQRKYVKDQYLSLHLVKSTKYTLLKTGIIHNTKSAICSCFYAHFSINSVTSSVIYPSYPSPTYPFL